MRTSASSLLLAAAILGAIGACTSTSSQTPSCVENVDQTGIHPVADGCEGFAVCPSGAPSTCCQDGDGGALTGNNLATCLYGYGGCAAIITTSDAMGNTTYVCSSTYDAGSGGGTADGG